MRFTTTVQNLNENLVNMNRVINTKNSLPILSDIVFAVKNGILTLKASDGEVTLMTTIELTESEGDGKFAVNGKSIMEAVKNLPETPLTFTVKNESNTVDIDYFVGVFSLAIDNADEFPSIPEMNQENQIKLNIKENILQGCIARTIFATADDVLRPVMNGLCFDINKDHLVIVATNGHILVRNKVMDVTIENGSEQDLFILPKKTAMILKNILEKDAEKVVAIETDKRQVVITHENFTMQSRLVEGRYPNYKSVIPTNNPNILTADRENFISALKRVAPFSNTSSNLVRLHLENDNLQLNAEDYDFSKKATEKVPCKYDGTNMDLGVKGCTCIEIFNNINAKEIEMQVAAPSTGVIILPSEQPENMDILILVMPMLLN